MAPLLTLARHAATYQAGIPTHNYKLLKKGHGEPNSLVETYLQPCNNGGTIPHGERCVFS
ncbi:hypothetical protein RvY_17488 [Ramazzottius varieornatus]|uniref:Uncharacterized protein n=1 Tax=Ramazzottius varieornatus TaxID=947166 RepID=A0A1D1W837_RAMVA|nr:hypothetical protein RvY_17488 [Ramazzottius varieornatus]